MQKLKLAIKNSKYGNAFQMPSVFKRFQKNQEGVTAIEFGILGFPFFLILTSIMEVSVFFFAGQYLDAATDKIARKVRVGLIDGGVTQTEFRTLICNETTLLFDCNKIKVDMRIIASYDGLGDDGPEPVDGALDDSEYQYQVPGPENLVQLTVNYEWPIITNYVAKSWSDLDGGALMNSVVAFKTEPFS
ncbi:MAG: TadE/TadG family type IV pilus assembly protein [Nitratireductor sp.]